jgi:methylglutaconyl-CoA hydratase
MSALRCTSRVARAALLQTQGRIAPTAACVAVRSAATLASSSPFTNEGTSRAFHTRTSALATPTTSAAAPASASSSLSDASSLIVGAGGAALKHVQVQLDSSLGALHVRMARPQLHNAFNEELIAELRSIFDAVAAAAANGDEKATTAAATGLASLRAVVLTGVGASFSAGADLNWMAKMRTYTEAENLRDAQLLFEMVHAIHACPVPVLARVNGAALGGGVGLVSACDIALSVSSAKFGLTEVKLGLSPAVISSFVMGKMTPSAASYYFLTGQRFDAEEARRVGLVHQVLDDENKLDQAVQKVLEELALNSPKAGRFAEYSTHSLALSVPR